MIIEYSGSQSNPIHSRPLPYPSPKRVCEGCPSGRGEGVLYVTKTRTAIVYERAEQRSALPQTQFYDYYS